MQFGLFMLHNPVEVAHRIAMLDHLARGRFHWGIGGGRFQRSSRCLVWIRAGRMWIGSDPQECIDRIRQLYETVGGFGMLLAITQDSDNPEWDHGSLQLLMEEVGPRVADLGRG